MKYFLLLLGFLVAPPLFSQPVIKQASVLRTTANPVIDGNAEDVVWSVCEPITDFHQVEPEFMAQPMYETAVRILFDDRYLYVCARMYDSQPERILTQLGNRDDSNLNADLFSISFDTYNNGLDAFTFEVYASGVQRDSRRTDNTYNAVWKSAVQITKEGWTAELAIPWSALRFSGNGHNVWRMQIQRNIRRFRQHIQWAPEPRDAQNIMTYWGYLSGINHVKSPVRLSVSPYLSAHTEHFPHNTPGMNNYSFTFAGGADLKYGINQGFTLDMTLLPDFRTVASDREIKNLSAFETVYSENREFFKEGTELFMKGGLFYSRRIGAKPFGYSSIRALADEGALIRHNPDRVQLINAAKISGRTASNTGLGIFNAITAPAYAEYTDSAGIEHTVLTHPLVNYNMAVIDQGLRHNSSVYLINTNVTRSDGYDGQNVTGSGLSYVTPSNRYRIDISGSLSQQCIKNEKNTEKEGRLGYRYGVSAGKIKGKVQFNFYHNLVSRHYDINALGLIRRKGEMYNGCRVTYQITEPTMRFLRYNFVAGIDHSANLSSLKPVTSQFYFRAHATTLGHISIWGQIRSDLSETYDYYEPRVDGRYYIEPRRTSLNFNLSSDYRKTIALDGGIEFSANTSNFKEIELRIMPIARLSDRWTFRFGIDLDNNFNDRGFVSREGTSIIFGERNLKVVENTLSSRYMFRNNLSISLWARHYWLRGDYTGYFMLDEIGKLNPFPGYETSHDFSFNTFNIDFIFDWEFAPGSRMNLVYKNAILREEPGLPSGYWNNFRNVIEGPQLNSLTLRLLYYIDYHSVITGKA